MRRQEAQRQHNGDCLRSSELGEDRCQHGRTLNAASKLVPESSTVSAHNACKLGCRFENGGIDTR